MPTLICLLGLFLASIFAIVVYGPMGLDPNTDSEWVDVVFWSIIAFSTVPLVVEIVQRNVKRIFRRLRQYHRSYRPLRNG